VALDVGPLLQAGDRNQRGATPLHFSPPLLFWIRRTKPHQRALCLFFFFFLFSLPLFFLLHPRRKMAYSRFGWGQGAAANERSSPARAVTPLFFSFFPLSFFPFPPSVFPSTVDSASTRGGPGRHSRPSGQFPSTSNPFFLFFFFPSPDICPRESFALPRTRHANPTGPNKGLVSFSSLAVDFSLGRGVCCMDGGSGVSPSGKSRAKLTFFLFLLFFFFSLAAYTCCSQSSGNQDCPL